MVRGDHVWGVNQGESCVHKAGEKYCETEEEHKKGGSFQTRFSVWNLSEFVWSNELFFF